jgi:predicted metalloprotease with PDZ domain
LTRIIDGRAVVTDLLDDDARKAGLVPGDTVVAIDGEPIAAKAKKLEKYVSAATSIVLSTNAHWLALRGPLQSTATLSASSSRRRAK